MKLWVILSATLFAIIASAQSAPPTEFPEGSVALTGDAIKSQLAGMVYTVTVRDGSTWRLQFTANGYLYLDTSYGYRDSGKWWVESGISERTKPTAAQGLASQRT